MKRNNETIKLDIEAIGFQGISIARKDNLVYFVKGAVPTDKVNAIIRKKRKNHIECDLIEILEPSPFRVPPRCSHFGLCGGCSWQHLDYEEQLKWKKQHVEDAFQRIGKIEVNEIETTLPSPEIFNYRNKMEFSFSNSRWLTSEEINSTNDISNKDFALGLHIPGRFDKVLDIEHCHIQNDYGNEILKIMKSKALLLNVTAYNNRSNQGFLRNLIIRSTVATNELMIILITNSIQNEEEQNYIDWFDNEFGKNDNKISVIGRAVNSTRSPVATEKPIITKGKGYITENILGIDFKISPYSFFQTNSKQLNNFIAEIINRANLKTNDTVWDLYCGTGSISLPASKRCKEIFGIEMFEGSVEDAKINAQNNKITNAKFICADLHEKKISELLNTLPKPNVIIMDPPRAGMHANLVNHLLEIKANTIVYVSCNPTTQARDCALLSQIYNVVSIRPVDMFPHTFHVESIAVLEKFSES